MSDSIKTRLEAVSSSLDTAINKANNLPDAGSGGEGSGANTVYISADASTSDIGSNGDIYIQRTV